MKVITFTEARNKLKSVLDRVIDCVFMRCILRVQRKLRDLRFIKIPALKPPI